MNLKKILILTPLLLVMQPVLAADDNEAPSNLMNVIGYGAILFTLLLFVVVLLVLLRAVRVMTRVALKSQGYTEEQIAAELHPPKKAKRSKEEVWNKLLSLKPLSQEKDLIMEHEYDGIQELDNPTPSWFMGLFYTTIAFAACYLLIYHVFGIGQLQYDEYKTEVAQAEIAKKEYLSKAANQVDENTVKLTKDPAVLAAGQVIFVSKCAPCHGDHAQGNVGPNLTDDYWLHGNKINDLFKTIKYGVLAKGMPTWEKQLSPKDIADVANYVKSLHGSHPAGAKEPQGINEPEESNKLAAK
ncbi:cytochrome C [Mucilaginibacter sp. PPCGB 2223]|uniref:cbb3-type cytochrome c oxidase N-terminal domain-containing protein n=1 Tax=Mucilaginibacter sp. PPCGB 2223 TaxID=1886027 RepID=UPI0008262AF9|nr:cbb3-type cytochrome c oxidase N-terminal domain-containing protein [Mucilaginibacter sp. PPCGB 2223]OCX53885.1 cytochrome C [Mucilaginibacter sp. PPCGB 2223]